MADEEQIDPKRVRIGFAVLAFVLIACMIGARQVDAGGPRVLLMGLAIFTLVRLFILMRSIRKGR